MSEPELCYCAGVKKLSISITLVSVSGCVPSDSDTLDRTDVVQMDLDDLLVSPSRCSPPQCLCSRGSAHRVTHMLIHHVDIIKSNPKTTCRENLDHGSIVWRMRSLGNLASSSKCESWLQKARHVSSVSAGSHIHTASVEDVLPRKQSSAGG